MLQKLVVVHGGHLDSGHLGGGFLLGVAEALLLIGVLPGKDLDLMLVMDDNGYADGGEGEDGGGSPTDGGGCEPAPDGGLRSPDGAAAGKFCFTPGVDTGAEVFQGLLDFLVVHVQFVQLPPRPLQLLSTCDPSSFASQLRARLALRLARGAP